jgi:hypothetical protein
MRGHGSRTVASVLVVGVTVALLGVAAPGASRASSPSPDAEAARHLRITVERLRTAGAAEYESLRDVTVELYGRDVWNGIARAVNHAAAGRGGRWRIDRRMPWLKDLPLPKAETGYLPGSRRRYESERDARVRSFFERLGWLQRLSDSIEALDGLRRRLEESAAQAAADRTRPAPLRGAPAPKAPSPARTVHPPTPNVPRGPRGPGRY